MKEEEMFERIKKAMELDLPTDLKLRGIYLSLMKYYLVDKKETEQ